VEGLGEAEGEMLAAHVVALGEYARYRYEVFEDVSDVVLERLVRRVVNVPVLVSLSASALIFTWACDILDFCSDALSDVYLDTLTDVYSHCIGRNIRKRGRRDRRVV
jgi:hypothetical protein